MAIAHHPDLELMQGDDWTIPFTLLQADGVSPLDLTGASLEWALINPLGSGVTTGESDVVITINDPPTLGTGSVSLSHTITEGCSAGRYFDSLRASLGSISTLWVGNLLIDADPFSV